MLVVFFRGSRCFFRGCCLRRREGVDEGICDLIGIFISFLFLGEREGDRNFICEVVILGFGV